MPLKHKSGLEVLDVTTGDNDIEASGFDGATSSKVKDAGNGNTTFGPKKEGPIVTEKVNKNFKAGDSKPDFTDDKGKDWMAKKGEDLDDLKDRAKV